MAKISFFSHDSNARNSEKLLSVRMKYGAAGYGIYFMIIERLREEVDYTSVRDYNMLGFDLRVDSSEVKAIVEDFGLFEFTEDGEGFYSESLNRRMLVMGNVSKARSAAGKRGANSKWGTETGERKRNNAKKRSERLAEARKKGTHTAEEWKEMLEFFGECVKCGSKERLCKDHIVPLYQGGSDGIDNLEPLCMRCNSAKGPDDTDYRQVWCTQKKVVMPSKWKKTSGKCLANEEKTPAKEKKRKEKKSDIERLIVTNEKKDFSSALSFYQKRYPTQSDQDARLIAGFVSEYGLTDVLAAMECTLDRKKSSMKYTGGILRNWRKRDEAGLPREQGGGVNARGMGDSGEDESGKIRPSKFAGRWRKGTSSNPESTGGADANHAGGAAQADAN